MTSTPKTRPPGRVRQQLQVLRDLSLLQFLGHGHYRLRRFATPPPFLGALLVYTDEGRAAPAAFRRGRACPARGRQRRPDVL